MLTNVARRLTAAELAREPRILHVVAWFDGYGQATGGAKAAVAHPRRFTLDEAAAWREGFSEAKQEQACHAVHGFMLCTQEAHDLNDRDAYFEQTLREELAVRRDPADA